MRRTRRMYTAEYRQQMVELVQAGRKPVELAKEYGVQADTIRSWVRQAAVTQETAAAAGLSVSELEELKRLRREVAVLREEKEILKKAGGLVRTGERAAGRIFEFMKAQQGAHAVRTLCRVLRVSASGYYAWLKRGPSAHALRDAELGEAIEAIHDGSHRTYGRPRIHAELKEKGEAVAPKRVGRLMKERGLEGVSRRQRVHTTVRDGQGRPAPDLVEREFSAPGPDQLWVADITYVPTWAGILYLAVVLDVWSRRVVGWAMATHLRTSLVVDALNMALAQRRPQGVIHHSDQGCQYTSIAFGARCLEAGVRPSMGSVGDCYDNAMCESFFATLECELLDRHSFTTPAQARRAIFEFIEGWYNPHRRHSALGQLSPNEFERRAGAAA
ncbi:MAG TPA: IS3 family transposase [Longimicrobiales bacterium]